MDEDRNPNQIPVKEIVANHLKAHGFDGLCSQDCGCPADDLFTCGEDGSRCIPGHAYQSRDPELGLLIVEDPKAEAEREKLEESL